MSTPDVGSSRMSRRGLLTSARARNVRCCSPPESSRMCLRASPAMPRRSIMCQPLSRSLRPYHGNTGLSEVQPIITTSRTVTGKFQSMVSSCGT